VKWIPSLRPPPKARNRALLHPEPGADERPRAGRSTTRSSRRWRRCARKRRCRNWRVGSVSTRRRSTRARSSSWRRQKPRSPTGAVSRRGPSRPRAGTASSVACPGWFQDQELWTVVLVARPLRVCARSVARQRLRGPLAVVCRRRSVSEADSSARRAGLVRAVRTALRQLRTCDALSRLESRLDQGSLQHSTK
jgi:hypothetical protein